MGFWSCFLNKIRHFLKCLWGRPPRGNSPTSSQEALFERLFPRLRKWSVTGPSTGQYNCIAWSVGITDQWIWPGYTVQDFDEFYVSHGWNVSRSCKREYRKRKVALYAWASDPNNCKHGSRETHDCNWHESKCGGLERIMHRKKELEGGSYGFIIRCYEKHDSKANLDLC
jgi:hypothetical protein